jgi:hypothetical protein
MHAPAARPNTFDGDVLLRRHIDDEWQFLPPVVPHIGESDSAEQLQRGPGVADLDSTAQRADAVIACHVLEAIEAMETSSSCGSRLTLTTRVNRPDPVRPEETRA